MSLVAMLRFGRLDNNFHLPCSAKDIAKFFFKLDLLTWFKRTRQSNAGFYDLGFCSCLSDQQNNILINCMISVARNRSLDNGLIDGILLPGEISVNECGRIVCFGFE